MDDFLHFLNTADSDSLAQLPGISRSLADNLIAARPFHNIDACLEVRGMGKNLLSRAMSAYADREVESEETDEPVVEEAAMPIEVSRLRAEPIRENNPSFGSRLGQALLGLFRAVLRLILLAMLIVLVAGAIYYGVPFFTQKFIAPVQQNAARVNELENEVASLQSQLTQMNDQLTAINGHMDTVEESLKAHSASLEKLETIQTALETELKDNHDQAALDLKREVMLTRILDMLGRARLYLAQSNFGLAKDDVQSAQDLLAELNFGSNSDVLTQATTRLDQALKNLPEFPVVASGDIEIAWQILVTGKTVATTTPELTSTPLPTPLSTLELTATPTAIP